MTSQRLCVLFVIPSLRGGGAERVVSSLLRHIDRGRFQLTLAVLDDRDAAFLEDVPDDVEIVVLHCARVRHAIVKIVRLIWGRRPNVVLSTLGHLNLALAVVRPILPNDTRYIARETSIVSLLSSEFPMYFWWGWAYRRCLRRLDAVVCQSDSMRNDLIQNFGLPPQKAVVIHNPVDIGRVRLMGAERNGRISLREAGASETIELVAAGSMTRVKGFDLLIEALALCGDSRLRLTLLGDGPLKAELQRLAVERGVATRVRFLGFQQNPYPYLAQADAFVLSSRFEGFPNVVLEALACGTPVISTPAPGGVNEILAGVDGCALAESMTAEALARAFQRFSFGHRLDAHAAAPYAVETITRLYEAVFEGGRREARTG